MNRMLLHSSQERNHTAGGINDSLLPVTSASNNGSNRNSLFRTEFAVGVGLGGAVSLFSATRNNSLAHMGELNFTEVYSRGISVNRAMRFTCKRPMLRIQLYCRCGGKVPAVVYIEITERFSPSPRPGSALTTPLLLLPSRPPTPSPTPPAIRPWWWYRAPGMLPRRARHPAQLLP
ncbi:hypothetical protein AAFF_G00191670 [Aldrovandia affinis]|uniref:Uncharacterized protein n=1 Tax=Aldrovandia affinis TaxID=143900 RepID=A0AAD7RJD4_9TELE|nr:hypothetical protein AAFF_G00191670 [Aldrovandia affinis]